MAKSKTSGIYFKVTDEERSLIEQRMALMGVHNMSAYIRKMCIDGYIVQLQIKELDECAKLLRYTSNNVNQIARRVNSGGGVYPDEVDEITVKLTEASGLFGSILEQLSKIQSQSGDGRKFFVHHHFLLRGGFEDSDNTIDATA